MVSYRLAKRSNIPTLICQITLSSPKFSPTCPYSLMFFFDVLGTQASLPPA
ncbi:MAG: hypothetical protein LBC74_09380 [Planctomycetaceae bacterium]|nr:hypothetical protein [Planctomycetaceae bacterium]